MTIKLERDFINSISIQLRVFSRSIVQAVDPWLFFNSFGFNNTLSLFANAEVMLHPSSSNNILRETLVNQPGVGPTTQRTVVESNIISNNNTNKVVQDYSRERDRAVISISPLIWIPCFFYAFSDWRISFTTKALNSEYIPVIFTEVFKRTRHSNTGVFRLTTGVIKVTFNALVLANPQLKDTFWDPDFLGSQTGINVYLGFIQLLAKSPGNYVPMVKPTVQNLPQAEAGNTTTFGVLSKLSTSASTFLNSTILVITGSSYQNGVIITTHINDANLVNAVYLDSAGKNFTGHENTSYQVEINGTLFDYIVYIVQRVTGLLPNRLGTPGDGSDLSDSKNKRRGDIPPTQRAVEKQSGSQTPEQPAKFAGELGAVLLLALSKNRKLRSKLLDLLFEAFSRPHYRFKRA